MTPKGRGRQDEQASAHTCTDRLHVCKQRHHVIADKQRSTQTESQSESPQTPDKLMLCMHAVLRAGEKQEQALPSPVSSLAAMRMESHLVSYPMQYRVFPKIQATALLMRGALKLELVHTLYPA